MFHKIVRPISRLIWRMIRARKARKSYQRGVYANRIINQLAELLEVKPDADVVKATLLTKIAKYNELRRRLKELTGEDAPKVRDLK